MKKYRDLKVYVNINLPNTFIVKLILIFQVARLHTLEWN